MKKIKDVDIDYSEGKKIIKLHRIVVPKEKRGQGIGSKAIKHLHEYADKKGKLVALTPSKDFGGSVSRLKKFYKSHGYVENKGKNRDFSHTESMYRKTKDS